MLDKLRKPTKAKSSIKSIVVYILFGIICFSFVFMGITPDDGTFRGTGAAATVNDASIPLADFRERASQLERQMGGSLSGLPAAQRQQMMNMINQSALEELINTEVVVQAAVKTGVYAVNAAVRDMIVNIPAFQENGRFVRERYDGYLSMTRSSAGEFEKKVQKDVIIGRMRDLLFKAYRTPKGLRSSEEEARSIKVNLEYVEIERANLNVSSLVKPQDISSFVGSEEGKNKINEYYEINRGEFTAKAEVKARHILIKTDKLSDAEALDQINAIKAELESAAELESTDFSELATKYSQDEGSKNRGGDLGFFSRGRMVPEFEDVAFSLPVGQVSEPVKSDFGYHLIMVEERRGGDLKPLEEVQSEIAKNILERESRDKAIEELRSSLSGSGELANQLRRLGLSWTETGEFSLADRSVPKLGDNPEVVNAGLSVANAKTPYSDLIASGGKLYMVRAKKLQKEPVKEGERDSFSMAAVEVFNNWAQKHRELAQIRTNQAVLE